MKMMINKKELGRLLLLLTLVWPVFGFIGSNYTPTQVILVVIFAYLGVRLWYITYFKNN
tara:strand:- start:214 stop:390 length:177 start_codon:yes stop_codon:yes gene_type:complete